uniref:Uncharacterized protein n=1 Tax=Timema genevievae TaxID=629358 RepID=A0A7R9K996_TIMGE|nr:unnamed protein product [Timema genevievae]
MSNGSLVSSPVDVVNALGSMFAAISSTARQSNEFATHKRTIERHTIDFGQKLRDVVQNHSGVALVNAWCRYHPPDADPMLLIGSLVDDPRCHRMASKARDVGSGIDPTFATVLMGSVRCLMSGCNTGLMKRFGRRPLCMLSGCGMAICLSVSGYFTWKILKEGNKELNWVPVMCIMLYVVTSMLGLLSIPWTMTAELFPTEIRGLAHSIAISVANLLMFVSIQTYLTTVDALGGPAQLQPCLYISSDTSQEVQQGKSGY